MIFFKTIANLILVAWQKFGLCTPVWDLILPGIRLCQWNVSTFYMIIIMQFLLRLRAEPRIAAEVYSQ